MSSAADYVPHVHDAVLLDAVRQEGEFLTCGQATVREGTPFADGEGWPAWLVIELMAQVVAASAGLREFRPGVRPRLGLLLGVRDFRCGQPTLPHGAALEIEALEGMRDATGMGVFDCALSADGVPVASAILSVYLPENVDEYLGSLEP